MTFYITGDKHGDFSSVFHLQNRLQCFTEHDTIILLGDAGFNYYVSETKDKDKRPYKLQKGARKLQSLLSSQIPSTIFSIHGNHEARPESIEGFEKRAWNGGEVWFHPDFPSLLYAVDGEVYTFNEKNYLVIGGAYSVDKWYRIEQIEEGNQNVKWFKDEQISEEAMKKVEEKIEEMDGEIHGVFSHTCPEKYIPTELFIAGVDQSSVDRRMEKWLDEIEEKLHYDIWYFGHFHGEKKIDKMCMYNQNIEILE